MNSYTAGQEVNIAVTVTNEALSPPALADPTTMKFAFAAPGATASTEYTWPIGGGEVVHDGTGTFHVNLDTTGSLTGIWRIVVQTTGVQGAQAHQFQVYATSIPVP